MALKYAMFQTNLDAPNNRIAINPALVAAVQPYDQNLTIIHMNLPVNGGHVTYFVKAEYDQVVVALSEVWGGGIQDQSRSRAS